MKTVIKIDISLTKLLYSFQIIRCFGFSKYIAFIMYLDKVYIYMHSKCNV